MTKNDKKKRRHQPAHRDPEHAPRARPAKELDHKRLARADEENEEKRPYADRHLQEPVDVKRPPRSVRETPAPEASKTQAQEKHGQDGAHREGRRSKKQNELTHPHDLIQQPARARDEKEKEDGAKSAETDS